MMTNRSKRGLALLTALALTAAACGSDDEPAADEPAATDAPADAPSDEPATTDAPSDEPATTDAPSDEPATTDAPAEEMGGLGEPNPATGEPLEIFYMWSGVSPTIDNTPGLLAARATVQWINEYGGGIGVDHRELVLQECSTDEDAAVAAACGSEIVDSDAPIVIFNVNGQVEPWATPTLAAGIPIFAFSSADAGLIAAPDLVSTMSNPVSGFGNFPAGLALELGVETTTISVIDVPAATGPAQALSAAIFGAMGAGTANVLPISPAATDHSADVQADLQANDPGLVHVIGNAAYCTLTWKALRDAGYEGAIGGISNCIDDATIEQMGSDIEGIYVSYTGSEDPTDPDYQTFLAIGEEYGLDFPLKGTPVGDYIVMEAFHRFMADYEGDYSSDSINAHIKGHGPVPVVGNPNASYNCDGAQVPGVAIACTAGSFYTQLDAEGNPTYFTGIS